MLTLFWEFPSQQSSNEEDWRFERGIEVFIVEFAGCFWRRCGAVRVLIGDKAAITDVAFCRRCHLLLAALPKRRPYSTYDMRNSHMLRETATRPLRGGTPHPPTPLFIIPGLDSPAPICQNKLPFRPTVCQYINGVVMTRAPRSQTPWARLVIKLRSSDDRNPCLLKV